VKRKIAVFTGTRAEYGLLSLLMKQIRATDMLELQIIVSGMHLSTVHGETWRQIEEDGFFIDARVEMLLSSDTAVGVAKSMGLGIIGFADAIDRLKPDILVVLGDRYEALAIAQAAMIARLPIAHIHGGETTEGVIDEAIRHSLTKMSHLHFVSTKAYRERVIQLGESPDRVWNVGAPALDNIAMLKRIGKEQLEAFLGIKLRFPSFLLTYHPVTLRQDGSVEEMGNLLEVLADTNGTIIITGTNADVGGTPLRRVAEQFAARRPDNIALVESLGSVRYLSLMSYVDVVVGNSSSGLLEAPAMGVPTVDIGDRQAGRIRAPSVIHCSSKPADIRKAITQALSPEHKQLAALRHTPYGKQGAVRRITDVLENHPLGDLLQKKFYDLRRGREIE
jgi:UDP-hydrolysing UDP-N-acetyl-D-glucosamine 2-epimerase